MYLALRQYSWRVFQVKDPCCLIDKRDRLHVEGHQPEFDKITEDNERSIGKHHLVLQQLGQKAYNESIKLKFAYVTQRFAI